MHNMDKLAAGAAALGLTLEDRQLKQFALFCEELENWNRRANLTSITGSEEVQVKHFLDSLTIAPLLQKMERADFRLIDIGTGAGFPGIPLKIVYPDIRLALLEATGKKTAFLSHLVSLLGLEDVAVINSRAEDAAHDPALRESFDMAAARAVAPLSALVELALPFCCTGGFFIAQKKGDIKAEVAGAQKAVSVLGGTLEEMKQVMLPGLEDDRQLIVIRKIRPSPPRYPRRPGIPLKRPIA